MLEMSTVLAWLGEGCFLATGGQSSLKEGAPAANWSIDNIG